MDYYWAAVCYVVATANTNTIVEDSAITVAIKVKIAENPVPSPNIKVETERGIVLLQGNVKTIIQANTAVEIAFSVEGVSDVDTASLHVQGGKHLISDSIITAKIKGTYI